MNRKILLPSWLLALLAASLLIACGPSARTRSVESSLEEYARLARTPQDDNRESQGSLWSERDGYADAFLDVKARRVADIVTIEVIESTSALSEASTATSRESSMGQSINSLAGLERRIAELPNLLDLSSSREFQGDATTSRRSVLQTSITAKVVEVFPNGNLLLEGNRELLINGERQVVTVRGVARPNDISPQNVVLSTRIAELEVEVEGHGIVSEAQRPGILFKILDGFWPF
ncbi:MAG TPA: flagellar basal body L-ring protein FlgH [Acidobacteriota bacterium]|nr:flagellar basal body L-ring protein FlgH [Acidobacteriota bacterium]